MGKTQESHRRRNANIIIWWETDILQPLGNNLIMSISRKMYLQGFDSASYIWESARVPNNIQGWKHYQHTYCSILCRGNNTKQTKQTKNKKQDKTQTDNKSETK